MIAMNQIESIRSQLLQHPMYKHLDTPERIRVFMKHHVFAVWDFMSLLKKLQNSLTSMSIPWLPAPHANYARFINEIVIGEETDEDGNGGYISHFELYIEAMTEVGADTTPITQYLKRLQEGIDPIKALDHPLIPQSCASFVKQNIELALHGKPHEVASAFFFGREDLIPDMFSILIHEMEQKQSSVVRLKYYLNRHIELDGDEHGPLAQKLLHSLCEEKPQFYRDAEEIAQTALTARIHLWDGVLTEIKEKAL
ncbi:DUF3050 domain-containing protein [Hazenella sp. IB182357]|uniref:DUF3050 domain-containing protein n=1 Tax=Polycladospora coralii TaxID=2771432 RepID=A0A926RSW1_9BACL|nr:DUF3050 domain-containing protein [Polycladospora coralii]MBD1370813.1 DUF3050 domain-containing protein [Polycladospora coralii]MBS7529752.1 DUF3050 domain-containing protein [Polycladospora coralii]